MRQGIFSTFDRLPWLAIAIGAALVARFGAFGYLSLWPIRFDPYKSWSLRARLLSPFDVVGIDIEQYIYDAERLSDGSWLAEILDYSWGQSILPPLTPALLWLFDYGPGHALPLSLFWLMLSCLWAIGWLLVLAKRGMSGPWLAVVGLLPTPVFYQFAIGTDLPFAVLFLAFYASYLRDDALRVPWIWALALMLLTATRSAAVSVLAFVILDTAHATWQGRRPTGTTLFVVGALAFLGMIVHLPWLFGFMVPSMPGGAEVEPYTFFGVTEAAYRAGLFAGTLPAAIDLPLSWAALIVAKTLYFCGFRLSFETLSIVSVASRLPVAVAITIPGLIWCFARGEWRDRLMVLLFLAPTLGGLAQERYNLPILPLLVLYAAGFWRAAWRFVADRKRTSASA